MKIVNVIVAAVLMGLASVANADEGATGATSPWRVYGKMAGTYWMDENRTLTAIEWVEPNRSIRVTVLQPDMQKHYVIIKPSSDGRSVVRDDGRSLELSDNSYTLHSPTHKVNCALAEGGSKRICIAVDKARNVEVNKSISMKISPDLWNIVVAHDEQARNQAQARPGG